MLTIFAYDFNRWQIKYLKFPKQFFHSMTRGVSAGLPSNACCNPKLQQQQKLWKTKSSLEKATVGRDGPINGQLESRDYSRQFTATYQDMHKQVDCAKHAEEICQYAKYAAKHILNVLHIPHVLWVILLRINRNDVQYKRILNITRSWYRYIIFTRIYRHIS